MLITQLLSQVLLTLYFDFFSGLPPQQTHKSQPQWSPPPPVQRRQDLSVHLAKTTGYITGVPPTLATATTLTTYNAEWREKGYVLDYQVGKVESLTIYQCLSLLGNMALNYKLKLLKVHFHHKTVVSTNYVTSYCTLSVIPILKSAISPVNQCGKRA